MDEEMEIRVLWSVGLSHPHLSTLGYLIDGLVLLCVCGYVIDAITLIVFVCTFNKIAQKIILILDNIYFRHCLNVLGESCVCHT